MKPPFAPQYSKIVISLFYLSLCLHVCTIYGQGEKGEQEKKDSGLKTVFAGPAGSFPSLGSCKMAFEVSWKDKLEAGQIQVELIHSSETTQVLATGNTTGTTHALLPVKGEFSSLIDSATLTTRAMEQTETRRERILISSVEIDDGTVQIKKKLKLGTADAEIKLSPEYKTEIPVFDIISAALFIRSQPLIEPGESYTLVVIPKSTPGPFTVTVIGREQREYQDKMTNCIKLEVSPSRARWRTTGSESVEVKEAQSETVTLTQDIKKRFQGSIGKCTVWISDDEYRLPLEATVEIAPIGEVAIELVQFEK